VDIPKNLHPDKNPEHMLQVGKLAGIVKAWAQNGPIFDVAMKDTGVIKKIHHQDMAMSISKLIIEKDETEKEKAALKKAKAKEAAVAKAQEHEAKSDPYPGDAKIAKEFADEAKGDKAALEAAAEAVAPVMEVVVDDGAIEAGEKLVEVLEEGGEVIAGVGKDEVLEAIEEEASPEVELAVEMKDAGMIEDVDPPADDENKERTEDTKG
jgi:hypothetical protein